MQAAVQAKMPRNQAFFGSFWADGRYVDCIKDNVQIDKTTIRLIQKHDNKSAAKPPFLGGFFIFGASAA